jgi:hypothetical protein
MSRAAGLMALAVLCFGSAVAQAQVYRCGPDGRSYSQEPCASGQAVDVADPRSAQQAAQTRQAALRDAREADQLERARLRAERQAARQGPALIGWSKPKAATDKSCSKGTACKDGAPAKPRSNNPAVTLYRESDAASR